jgi:hypothetical protein
MSSVGYWIRVAFPDIDHEIGTALWTAFVNRNVYTPKGELIQGTFRWWGGVIADIVGRGESYLDYYCEYAPDYLVDEVTDKLLFVGWKIEDIDEICPKCQKPMKQFETLSVDIKTGVTTHASCADDEKQTEVKK